MPKEKQQKDERELLAEISAKLDRVIGLLATAGKELDEKIEVLRGLGLEWNVVGPLVGLNADAARMRMSKKSR